MPNELLDKFIESLSNKEFEYVNQKIKEVASRRNFVDSSLAKSIEIERLKTIFRLNIEFLSKGNVKLYHFCQDNNILFLEELEFAAISSFRNIGLKSFISLRTIMEQYGLDTTNLLKQFHKYKNKSWCKPK